MEGIVQKAIGVTFLIVVLIFGLLFSCSQPSGNDFEFFKVKVDSLDIPASIPKDDTLFIGLYGMIGTNGCYEFSHFEAQKDTFELKLTVWGKYDLKAIVCPTVVVYLDTVYSVFPLYPGLFYIEIEQPDGLALKDSVTIW
jgi:hypothetical protein